MIDSGMNAVVNAPYPDTKVSGASGVRDEDAKNGFNDALSKAKDDRSGHRDRLDSETQTKSAKGDEPQENAAEKNGGAETETVRRLAARKLIEAMTATKTGRESLVDVEGLSKELGDATKAVKSSKHLDERIKGSKKTDDEVETSQTSTQDTTLVNPDGLALAGVPQPQASTAENSIEQIVRALNKFGADDEPVRVVDHKSSKIDASMKADLPPVGGVGDTQDTTDNGGGDATFRFSSSRSGSSRSMDMTVSRNEGRTEFEVREPSSKVAENVTVLDSRRYIGLAPSTNASALTGLIAGDREWVSAMQPGEGLSNAAAQSSTGRVVHTLKLHLTPIDLGSVTMSLRMVGDELAVHMTVENSSAYRKLQDDNKSMLEALKSHGLSVDNITISIASSDKSDQTGTQANNQQNQSAQQNSQQLTDGRNRGESEANGSRQFGNGSIGGRDEIVEGSVGVAGSDLSAGVYL